MLDLLRRKAQSPYIQATILIIILVFVFWGVGSNRGVGRTTVATVGDKEISYQEYQNAYEQQISQIRDQFGGNIPKGLLDAMDIKRQVINQLIQQALLQKGAEDAGLSVSKDEIRNTIQEMASFRTNGIFDMQRYQQILAGSRMSVTDFEAGVQSDMLNSKIMDHLSRFAHVAEQELKDRFAFDNEEIKLEYVSFDSADFKDQVKPTADELATFFDERKNNYKTDPQVKLKYISFLFDDAASASQFSEKDIEEYYQQHSDKYVFPEKRQARHILIRTSEADNEETIKNKREQMEVILGLASAGKDFAELAKEHSEDSSAAQGGDLGSFSRGQMVKPFEDVAFALKKEGISDIVQTQFGFHIIKLENIEPGRTITRAEARKDIEATLFKEKGKNVIFKQANEAYEKIILSGSLEKYAATVRTSLDETDYFSQKTPPQRLVTKPAVLQAAFNLNKGELSSLIEDGTGYSIIYIEDIKKPEIPPLDYIKTWVTKDLVTKQAKDLAEETAMTLLEKLEKSADWQEETKKLNKKVQETSFFSRANRSATELPAPVIEAGFSLRANAPYPKSVGANENKFYVFRLKEKKEPAAELFSEKQDALKNQLQQENQMRLLAAWLEYLRGEAEVEVNKDFL